MLIENNSLLQKPSNESLYQQVTSKTAGWNYLNFEARILKKGQLIEGNTGQNEYIFVLISGNFSIVTIKGEWKTENGRSDVFSGLPHAVYLPINTEFSLHAESEELDIACGWCPADKEFDIQYITPLDVHNNGVEFRGGDNASRQINSILPPGSNCQRLVCVEVYTPSGNWSSFPAHKHDSRKTDSDTGTLTEASLEEFYFYKVDKPQGFALQQIYTDDRSLDELVKAQNNDLVLVPKGYHPVVAGHGYNVYYLNFLAGSDQSLANTDDPDHKWVYGTWKGMDPRLPMVTLEMNK